MSSPNVCKYNRAQYKPAAQRIRKWALSYYLGRGMDPDGRVEQNVVTQLLEQQDAILQIAKVSGKGQHDVQDRPCHVYLGRLERRQEDGGTAGGDKQRSE